MLAGVACNCRLHVGMAVRAMWHSHKVLCFAGTVEQPQGALKESGNSLLATLQQMFMFKLWGCMQHHII